MIEITVDGDGQIRRMLESLPANIARKRGPVRKALGKGARLLRDQARINLRTVARTPGKTGENHSTGFTAKQIIAKRRRSPRDPARGERYIVTVKYVEHPNRHKRNKTQPWRANDAAFLLEYGSSKQPAEPWLRPAFEARKAEAVNVSIQTFRAELDKLIAAQRTQP